MAVVNASTGRASSVEEVLLAGPGAAALAALPTGFSPLDATLDGGLRPHDLVIIGGRPGVGKTVAALQWARAAAASDKPAMYVCFEHTEIQLVGRLLASELGEVTPIEHLAGGDHRRRLIRRFVAGEMSREELLASDSLLEHAYDRLMTYARRLHLVRGSSVQTDLAELDSLVRDHDLNGGAVFIDYLQKVAHRSGNSENDAQIRLAEGLKEIALSEAVSVVAIAASDRAGLHARRLRLADMRGSVALAYEADVAIMLNEKATAVSKVHLAYDDVRARTFRDQVLFTVEKNRGGPAPIEIEFSKDFPSYRFNTQGAYVTDRLVDDLTVTE